MSIFPHDHANKLEHDFNQLRELITASELDLEVIKKDVQDEFKFINLKCENYQKSMTIQPIFADLKMHFKKLIHIFKRLKEIINISSFHSIHDSLEDALRTMTINMPTHLFIRLKDDINLKITTVVVPLLDRLIELERKFKEDMSRIIH